MIVIDEVLGRFSKLRLPPLAVGMGMYLPMSLTLLIPIGALLGRCYDRWAERQGGDVEFKKRLGVLMATGLIVGESLFGVVFAGIVAASGFGLPAGHRRRAASRTGRSPSAWCCSWPRCSRCTARPSARPTTGPDYPRPDYSGRSGCQTTRWWRRSTGTRSRR